MNAESKTGLMRWDGKMKTVKKIICAAGIAVFLSALISCQKNECCVNQTEMKKAGSLYVTEKAGYTDEGITETAEKVFESSDGICRISKMQSYYDVILDYEKGTPEQAGRAYARTILQAACDYEAVMEPYLYENIHIALVNMGNNFELLLPRMNVLLDSLPSEYREEVTAFAEEISGGRHGFAEDGKLSYEETMLFQMIPDALRGTSCSALSLWGEKTLSGKNIMCRNLEWILGSEKQMCRYHSAVHMKKGRKSLTSISILGLLDIVTAVNDDGVFAAILDAGSGDENFEYEGKKCYTFELRKALEDYASAKDIGNFMVSESRNFTYSHNIALSDSGASYCAEDACSSLQDTGRGYSVLRTSETPIFDELTWEHKDAMCILNSYITKGNFDQFSASEGNLVRLVKYNNWLKEKEKFSVADVKELLTQEKVDQKNVVNVHSRNVFHTVIVDYATGEVQAAFTGTDGVQDKPVFVSLGHY